MSIPELISSRLNPLNNSRGDEARNKFRFAKNEILITDGSTRKRDWALSLFRSEGDRDCLPACLQADVYLPAGFFVAHEYFMIFTIIS